ncbi:MAG: hypothetical protein ACI90V_006300, partial [Bacillariaceae sp.]
MFGALRTFKTVYDRPDRYIIFNNISLLPCIKKYYYYNNDNGI